MPKASITTKSGSKIVIDGSQEEILALIAALEGGGNASAPQARATKSSPTTKPVSRARVTPLTLLSDLIDGGFFKKPRGLGEIRLALEEQGHFYPVTSLSPTMLRLVRKKELRRIKNGNNWAYVN